MDVLPQLPAEVVEFADSSGELVVSVNRDRLSKKKYKILQFESKSINFTP